MRRVDRIKRQYRGEYHYGERIANRLHVGSSDLRVIRECWRALRGNAANLARDKRDARHALYRGALAAHKSNRNLFIRYRF